MIELDDNIPGHPHLAVAKSATALHIHDGVAEILTQASAQVSAIQVATQLASENGGDGPSHRVVSNALWGVFRQLEVASQLLEELPRRDAAESRKKSEVAR